MTDEDVVARCDGVNALGLEDHAFVSSTLSTSSRTNTVEYRAAVSAATGELAEEVVGERAALACDDLRQRHHLLFVGVNFARVDCAAEPTNRVSDLDDVLEAHRSSPFREDTPMGRDDKRVASMSNQPASPQRANESSSSSKPAVLIVAVPVDLPVTLPPQLTAEELTRAAVFVLTGRVEEVTAAIAKLAATPVEDP